MTDPLVALVGGDEFRREAEEVDSYLIERTGKNAPRVAILPTAAAPENAPLAAEHGIQHFRSLGVEAEALMVVDRASANSNELASRFEKLDLVYIAGGDPHYLLDTLRDSLAWRRLSAAVRKGKVLAGSSAGAMILGETMHFRGERIEALDLLPGICVLPHFQEWGARALPGLRQASAGFPLILLGIDGATGCVGWGDEWNVVGPGAVTVIRSGHSNVFHDGEHIQLATTARPLERQA